jgi:hypothetical protein
MTIKLTVNIKYNTYCNIIVKTHMINIIRTIKIYIDQNDTSSLVSPTIIANPHRQCLI